MLKTILTSYKKQKKIVKISKILGDTSSVSGIDDIALKNDTQEKALDDLIDICETDKDLKFFIDKHGSNREELKHLYRKLMESGAGQWAKGHFVAASAFIFGSTLDYLLSNSQDDLSEISFNLIEYFEKGKTGEVSNEEK